MTPPPPGPSSKTQCKNGGWQTFTNPAFANQGACIKYVNGLSSTRTTDDALH